MEQVIEASLKKIGIDVKTREFSDFYTPAQNISNNFPLLSGAGWGKDYSDASTYMVPLFDSGSILATGNSNYSLVGITPAQNEEQSLGADGNLTAVPSVDADIARCDRLAGRERVDCWISLDRKLMEEVVPWVPYLDATNVDIIGEAVSK